MNDRLEVIDAFVDGERVESAALKQALAEQPGRDYFVDAWLLREGVLDELAQEPVPQVRPRADRRWPMLAIAASLAGVMVGGVAGYQLGVPRSEPGATAAATVPTAASPGASFPAPPATREIAVEFNSVSGARGGN
jgi:hypothetical protein